VAASRERVVVGLVATEALPAELAGDIAEELPEEVSERFPDVEWRVEVSPRPPTPRATNETELLRSVHRFVVSLVGAVLGVAAVALRRGGRAMPCPEPT
jgi:hypothetical protein